MPLTAVFSCMSPLLGAQASRLPCKAAKMAALPGHIQVQAALDYSFK
jgi:hypothetical protein